MERKENVLIIEEQIENLCRNREYVFIHLRVYVSASFRLQISDTIVKLVNNETQCRYLIVLQTSNTLCLGLLIHFSSTVLALPFSYFACPQAGFPHVQDSACSNCSFFSHPADKRHKLLLGLSKGQERTFLEVFSSHLLVALLAEI